MGGLELHVVGRIGWMLILAAAVLLAFALLCQRRKRAILQTYLTRYGSKLFFSVHPNLKKSILFSALSEGKTVIPQQDPKKREKREKKLNQLKQQFENQRERDISEEDISLENWDAYASQVKKNIPKEDISLEDWDACISQVEKNLAERENIPNGFQDFDLDKFPYLLLDRQNSLISSGKNSDVYLAAHKRTGKTVVIKVGKALKENKKQLQEIVFSLRDLRHPMIPTLYDFYSNDNKLNASYTVMEYIDGQTLEEALKQNALVPQPQCLNWICDLLGALSYLHSKGITHGDINPSNIILSHDGSLHLIDFSKAIATLNGGANPPQDLYQLGAMMFRFLTAQVFSERETPEAREALLRKRNVSELLIRIILKATEADEENRYQSAKEMLSDLENMIRKGEEVRHNDALMKSAYALSALALICGNCCVHSEQKLLILERGIGEETRQASAAFDEGDYSQALEHAWNAANSAAAKAAVSGKVKAEAQRVLAKILGVYDLSPGYQPDYSIGSEILLGRPLKAAISPDGKRLAVLVSEKADADGVPTVLYLQFFDAQNGRQLAKPVKAYPSALSELEFLDDRILFYAGERDMTVCALPEESQNDGKLSDVQTLDVGKPATGIAISFDGGVAASVKRNDDEAILYHVVRDGDSVRLADAAHLPFPPGKAQSARDNDTFTDPMDNLFALDETGERLALSFADGSLYIVDIGDFSRLNDPEIYREISLPSDSYQHFEGGFCGGFFLCSASTKSLSGAVSSYYQTIRTDTMEVIAGLSAPGEIRSRCHALADSGAAYISVENVLRRADFSSEKWETIDDADASITLLCHDAGRVLIVTANYTATAYDDEEGKSGISAGTPYGIAAFAGETLLLASQDRPTLSILRWTERKPILRYDPAFEHMYASVHSDLSSSFLFRTHDCQAFDADGYSIGYHAFDDYAQILKQYYQRALESGGEQDMLVTVYADRIDYYDAKSAAFLYSEQEETNPDDSDKFSTEDYFIETRVNEFIRVHDCKTNKVIWEVNKENLKDAVQQGDELILSMLTMDGTQYSLLLSKQGDILAELPNLCDVLPNQELAFDYGRGQLFAGRLYSMEDLIALASDRRNQRA